jgi:hypothetical protein
MSGAKTASERQELPAWRIGIRATHDIHRHLDALTRATNDLRQTIGPSLAGAAPHAEVFAQRDRDDRIAPAIGAKV